MKTQKGYFRLIFLVIIFMLTQAAMAQNSVYERHFNNGTALYNSGRYYEAGIEFRRAQEIASAENDWAAAIYWVILSELAYSDYGSAIRDMEELERKAPSSVYNRDMAYHKGRVYFNQGYFENSLVLFRRYIDSVTETGKQADDRKAAAFFWMGECLFTMGQFNEAERFYSWVVDTYPESPKKEISSYRIDLIRQKKIEAELLALLQWSHEESLRTNEEYQRRIRTYEYTLNAYQRRIAELTQGNTQGNTQQMGQNNFINEPYIYDEPVIEEPVIHYDDWLDADLDTDEAIYSAEYNEYLLERARLLGIELEKLISEYEHGAAW